MEEDMNCELPCTLAIEDATQDSSQSDNSEQVSVILVISTLQFEFADIEQVKPV